MKSHEKRNDMSHRKEPNDWAAWHVAKGVNTAKQCEEATTSTKCELKLALGQKSEGNTTN